MTRLLATLAAISTLAACGTGEDERIHCEELLPPEDSGFEQVVQRVVRPGPKSCGTCHNTETPLYGLNFEGRAVAHEALTTKMHLIWPQVATGAMPAVGEPWTPEDLDVLRSWYCRGGLYAEAP